MICLYGEGNAINIAKEIFEINKTQTFLKNLKNNRKI